MIEGEGTVGYIYSKLSSDYFDLLPSNIKRSSIVHELVKSLGLFDEMQILAPRRVEKTFFSDFHSLEYLNVLFSAKDGSCSIEKLECYGLVDDCFPFKGLTRYCEYMGGCIEAIINCIEENFKYVIFWDGGRHHAQGSLASGFCYINDVVVLILKLLEYFDKILYIDLDLHHGDGICEQVIINNFKLIGVEKAFYFSDKVFTVSIHKSGPGFFPGSGSHLDRGRGLGQGCNLNIPINYEISGKEYLELFRKNLVFINQNFNHQIIVLQCGADTLASDPHKGFNLGSEALETCIQMLLDMNGPIIFLGGGGYNHTETAILWSRLTHRIVKHKNQSIKSLPTEIPESNEYWPLYRDNSSMIIEEKKN